MATDPKDQTGLGMVPTVDWVSTTPQQELERPIDRLEPDSELHRKVLEYLKERISMSEMRMSQFYARWRAGEMKLQAYVNLPDYEKLLKEQTSKGAPPEVVSIVVPYSFATVSTVVTYMIHTFAGRKPMFQVGSNQSSGIEPAAKMEVLLQYNADHVRLIRSLFQYFNDGEIYGLGVLRTQWQKAKSMRTVWKTQPKKLLGLEIPGLSEKVRVREEHLTYEGNDVSSIDPFLFFPDPRVPMTEVNTRGEFVFWRSFEGKHSLLKAEASGQLKWVKRASQGLPKNTDNDMNGESARGLLSNSSTNPGYMEDPSRQMKNYYQVDQGSIEIIPAELGLGNSKIPEKWLFTILNKSQIVQAERMDLDHDMHPVAVIEPYTMGYGFGQPGLLDYLGPVQDTISWFINSHIHNVRAALNDMFVVDPSLVEMQDLLKPGPGKVVRLKRASYGTDVRTALQQLNVVDVTSGHMRDLQTFMKMGDALSSVTDNLRGLQDGGGRKTATEVRTSGEAGASRLAAHCRLVSAQGMVDLTTQMTLNIQQNMSEEFYFAVMGEDGRASPMRIAPEMITGDFHFPIHDGTLPIDRVAMLDVWREIFMAVAQDQQLRSEFDVGKIFEYIAELGGAKNIERFKAQVAPMPNAQVAGQAQAGNLVPMQELAKSGIVSGLGGPPANRERGGF